MTLSHIIILGIFVAFGSLGLASIQASLLRVFAVLRSNVPVKRSAGLVLASSADSRKLSWK